MRKRIKYFTLVHEIPDDHRQEVLRVCPFCSARLYLEGKANHAVHEPVQPTPLEHSAEPLGKRRRTVAECVQELKDWKAFLDSGALDAEELPELKARLIRGN